MAAPLGNQFWKLRSKHGRDKLFADPELLREEIAACFQWCDENPWYKTEQLKKAQIVKDEKGKEKIITTVQIPTARPYTLSFLCMFLNASENYWKELRKNKNLTEDYLAVISWAEEVIRTQKFEGAAVGAFNANIISRDLGLADRSELTGRDGVPLNAPTVIIQAPEGIDINLPNNTDGDE